jgi:selenide,water dikinase
MADLVYVLRHLPPRSDPNLLAGADIGDDAGVYRLSDDLALVQTVDFFTPIVDDPYTFGRIAAANSLSDVYAMGGTPLTALNIVGFPVNDLPVSLLSEILRGGADVAREAEVTIVGGHTVDDAEPKYGLAVTGTVHPAKFVSGKGAQAGDLLILTKPIGTGVITTALKAGAAAEVHLNQAVKWMTTLNRRASLAMLESGARACSDITGYGLVGHLLELLQASDVAARLEIAAIPLLPGALDYARQGYAPAGTHTNLEAVGDALQLPEGEDAVMPLLLADPQTSGGLLISLPPDRLSSFERSAAPDMLAAVIGSVESGPAGIIRVDG